MEKKIIIFSDYDGTITQKDVVLTIMEKFAPPEWIGIKNELLVHKTVNLKNGIEKLFNLISSSKKDEIESYINKEIKIRDGFNDFIEYCKKNNIEFNVVSAGLGFHIYPILKNYESEINIYCNDADFSSEKIKIKYKYLPVNCASCGGCGCCKVEVLEKYENNKYFKVFIGDGLADLAPSRVSDLVFARSDLIKFLDEENKIRSENSNSIINYIKFETFYDIKNYLEKIGEKKFLLN